MPTTRQGLTRQGLTRQGWTILAAAVASAVIGRVFGIIELYVIAAGTGAAVIVGVASVWFRGPSLTAHRWIHPPILAVGDHGRVDLLISNDERHRSPRISAIEPVGTDDTARITIGPLRAGQRVDAAYRIPAARRGVLELGPLELERRDQLGLATAWRIAAPVVEVVVAPRTYELPMPDLGHGVLGRHLLTQAQRMGAGEFHSLRDYVDGDEPRMINWRASARSDDLKVRQHTTEGVRRCIVVLDRDRSAYGTAPDDPAMGNDSFERAVTAAASLVHSGDRAGLTTRFVTGGGIDLRGPDVASSTLRVLARLTPGGAIDDVERDPGEGLGLVIVVTASPTTPTWRRTETLLDPTLTRVGIFTGGQQRSDRLSVEATSVEQFLDGWEALAGRGGLDVRRNVIEHEAARA